MAASNRGMLTVVFGGEGGGWPWCGEGDFCPDLGPCGLGWGVLSPSEGGGSAFTGTIPLAGAKGTKSSEGAFLSEAAGEGGGGAGEPLGPAMKALTHTPLHWVPFHDVPGRALLGRVDSVPRLFLPFAMAGVFASVSKITKVADQTPSSVTSTPRTPRMDFSRMTARGRKEKDKEKERDKKGRVGCAQPLTRSNGQVMLIQVTSHTVAKHSSSSRESVRARA